jgi:hypothetical protein
VTPLLGLGAVFLLCPHFDTWFAHRGSIRKDGQNYNYCVFKLSNLYRPAWYNVLMENN